MSDLLDPGVLAAIDSIEGGPFEGDVWRVTWASRDPLAGNSAGGRWSPDGRFETLYTSREADGAVAEIYYHLSRAPIAASSHMRLNKLSVKLEKVLSLGVAKLVSLDIEEPLAARLNAERSQAIGEAARMLDYQGLIVPSARWDCDNLVLFIDQKHFDLNEHIELLESSDINWPAWKEQMSDKIGER